MNGSEMSISMDSAVREALFEQLRKSMSDESSEAVISMLMYAVPEQQEQDHYDISWAEALEFYRTVMVERCAEAARYVNRHFIENTLITTGVIVRAVHAAAGKKLCEFY